MKTRVLRLLPELDFGGVESRLEVQARLYDSDAYELRVCGFHKPGKAARALRDLGIPVDVLNVDPAPRNARSTLSLARYLHRCAPDIVHASIAEANFHSLVAGPLSGVPLVIAEETGMPSHSQVARLAYRGAYQFADAIVGVTNAVCDYVRDVDHAPADRVRLIYNCANPRFFPEERASTVRGPAEPLVLLLVGRLVPVKNHLFFIEVLERVLPTDGSVRVMIAGNGPLHHATEAAIRTRGLGDHVELLGERSDVQELLRRAHVFALPSVSEGCSVSLIEAMASGAHAIGSNVPGIREVLGPLAGDWTAKPSDMSAWEALLRRTIALGASERALLAARGQARAYDLFSPYAYVDRLAELYAELRARPRRTPRLRNALWQLAGVGTSFGPEPRGHG